jgi:Lamin Tail Domain/CotH kinase protein/Chitobiase/beta-hexosaminidase C-terminal domain
MYRKLWFILLSLLALMLFNASKPWADTGTLRITEIMASNSSTISDEDGDQSDWIEIYNPSGVAVNLSGWYLTDNASELTKWAFPSVVVSPGAYLVVFASGKNRTTMPLHTNFKLSAEGEFLGLVESDGTTIASGYSPAFPAQYTDISYGEGSSGGLRYFDIPTPGAANGAGYAGIVQPVVFSVKRGFYDAPFSVNLSSGTSGATITYTTSGAAPTSGSMEFSGSIPINTTTVLRAAAFKNDFLPARVETHSYIFLTDVLAQPAVIPGYPNNTYSVGGNFERSVVHDNEMDPDIVNDPVYGPLMIDAMKAVPTMSIVVDPADIFGDTGFYDGEDIIKQASVEVIYPYDPTASHQADAGIESHSHNRLKRSLRLNFKPEYGASWFNTDLFQRSPLNGDSATDRVKRIILRGGNNRSWARDWEPDKTTYTEDQFYRDTQIALSGIGSHGTFVHLYINGIYWGLYNPVERADEHFTSEYLGGDSEDWFFLNQDGATDGDATRWSYLTGTLVNKDLSNPTNYAEFQQYLDIDHFIDYLITSWYQGVTDWPGNNWYFGNRNATSPLGSTPGQYYAWDGEWSWDTGNNGDPPNGPWVHPLFRKGASSTLNIAKLWHAVRVNDEFMMRFADRVQRALFYDGTLTDANARARWKTLNDSILLAILGESARWGDALASLGQPTRTRDIQWQAEVNAIDAILDGSAATFLAALKAQGFYPSIDAPVFGQRGGNIPAGYHLTITNPNTGGSIYYTTDGKDPRAVGGSVGSTATAYSTPIILHATTTVNARVLDGTQWSALATALFAVNNRSPLRITEMNYNPAEPTALEGAAGFTDNNDFEYIELWNSAATVINLNGVVFTYGITFTFGNIDLQPGEYIVAVKNLAAFEYRYGTGINVAGEYSGKLDSAGERIVLVDASGLPIHDFTYDDTAPWPESPDGNGPSLEVIDTEGDYNSAGNWKASLLDGGSPGTASPQPCYGDVEPDNDVDGTDLAAFAADVSGGDLSAFAENFGLTNCSQ